MSAAVIMHSDCDVADLVCICALFKPILQAAIPCAIENCGFPEVQYAADASLAVCVACVPGFEDS